MRSRIALWSIFGMSAAWGAACGACGVAGGGASPPLPRLQAVIETQSARATADFFMVIP